MKKRRRFPLLWLVLLAGAVALEMVVVEGALQGDAPLSRVADGLRRTLAETGAPANAAPQDVYIWKDSSGVTHIGEKPPASAPGDVRELRLSPQSPATPSTSAPTSPPALPPSSEGMPAAQAPSVPSEGDTPPAGSAQGEQAPDAGERERLLRERENLEKQFYRARIKGDGYAQIRFRHLLEANRQALEKLGPQE